MNPFTILHDRDRNHPSHDPDSFLSLYHLRSDYSAGACAAEAEEEQANHSSSGAARRLGGTKNQGEEEEEGRPFEEDRSYGEEGAAVATNLDTRPTWAEGWESLPGVEAAREGGEGLGDRDVAAAEVEAEGGG